MTRQVTCLPGCPIRSGRLSTDQPLPEDDTGPAISGPVPFHSPLREEVLASVCDRCWQEWLKVQIKVINEFALNLGDPRSHDIIEAHARDFFGLSDTPATTTDFSSLGDEPPAH